MESVTETTSETQGLRQGPVPPRRRQGGDRVRITDEGEDVSKEFVEVRTRVHSAFRTQSWRCQSGFSPESCSSSVLPELPVLDPPWHTGPDESKVRKKVWSKQGSVTGNKSLPTFSGSTLNPVPSLPVSLGSDRFEDPSLTRTVGGTGASTPWRTGVERTCPRDVTAATTSL